MVVSRFEEPVADALVDMEVGLVLTETNEGLGHNPVLFVDDVILVAEMALVAGLR